MATKMTKAQRLSYQYLLDAMERFEWDMHHRIMVEGRIPSEWQTIWREREPARRDRVTVRLDADVLRFFKSMGPNYGPRMNNVLRAFMQARLSGVIEGEDTLRDLEGTRFLSERKPEYRADMAYLMARQNAED